MQVGKIQNQIYKPLNCSEEIVINDFQTREDEKKIILKKQKNKNNPDTQVFTVNAMKKMAPFMLYLW